MQHYIAILAVDEDSMEESYQDTTVADELGWLEESGIETEHVQQLPSIYEPEKLAELLTTITATANTLNAEGNDLADVEIEPLDGDKTEELAKRFLKRLNELNGNGSQDKTDEEEITISIYPCDCTECGGKNLVADIQGNGFDDSTGGYEDLGALLDNVKEILLASN